VCTACAPGDQEKSIDGKRGRPLFLPQKVGATLKVAKAGHSRANLGAKRARHEQRSSLDS